MGFSNKLDFLMRLTNTPNSILARYLSFDPSYVSRLRRGERKIRNNFKCIKLISDFFAKKNLSSYQKSVLSSTLNNPNIENMNEKAELSKAIFEWLSSENQFSDPVGVLLSSFSSVSLEKSPHKLSDSRSNNLKKNDITVYYGNEGKRVSTITLFSLILQLRESQTLLLYSDENPEWATENTDFLNNWSELLWQIILQGHKIKIIHKISRNIDEMLYVIQQWLPYYTSGAVEPYYYPKLRDGVYKRSLSVVPGIAAVFSTSVGESAGETPNFMTTNKTTVDSFTNEFYSYLSLCKPLIYIHATDVKNFTILLRFGSTLSNSILKSETLPIETIPIGVLQSIYQRSNTEFMSKLMLEYKNIVKNFENKAKQYNVYHIIKLADIEDIVAEKVPLFEINAFTSCSIYYLKNEYKLHLQNIIRLLKSYENYHVIIEETFIQGYYLNAIEEYGILVLKSSPSSIMFEINEANLTSAFWEYFARIKESKQKGKELKEHVIDCIEQVISQIH